jgi:hypothetical protein
MPKWLKVSCVKVITGVIAVAGATFWSSVAKPQEVQIEQYRHPKTEEFRDLDRLYLGGVKSGLIAYNTYLAAEHKEPSFCLPGALALTSDQADDILLRWVKKHHPPDDWPVSLALLYGLQETFPCQGNK